MHNIKGGGRRGVSEAETVGSPTVSSNPKNTRSKPLFFVFSV